MSWFSNDDDEDVPQKKGFFSSIGSFLWTAVKWAAIIALAVVTLGAIFHFSKGAREAVDGVTGDLKLGTGMENAAIGMKNALVKGVGAVNKDAGEGLNDALNKAGDAINKATGRDKPPPTAEDIAHKAQDKKTEGLKNVAGWAGTAVPFVAGYKGVKAFRETGTLTEDGKFVGDDPATTQAAKDIKAAQKNFEALQKSEKAAAERARVLAKEASDLAAKESAWYKPTSWFADSRIDKANKAAAEAADKLVKLQESIKAAQLDLHLQEIGTTAQTGTETTRGAAALKNMAEGLKDLGNARIGIPSAAAIGETLSSAANGAKALVAPVAGVVAPIARFAGLAGGLVVAGVDGSHTKDLWDHTDKDGKNDSQGSAVMQGVGTVAEVGGLVAGMVSFPAVVIGSGLKDATFVVNTIANGGEQKMTRSGLANLLAVPVDWAVDKLAPDVDVTKPVVISPERLAELKKAQADVVAAKAAAAAPAASAASAPDAAASGASGQLTPDATPPKAQAPAGAVSPEASAPTR